MPMGNLSQLPAGFQLEQPNTELPQGFQLEAPQFQSESEIPIESEIDLPFAPKPQQPEPSFLDKAIGAGEALLTTATGATSGALGFIGGIGAQLPKEIQSGEFGTPEAADRIERAALEQSQAQTFAPRTEVGQDIVQGLGEALEPLTAVAPQLAGALPLSRGALSGIKKPVIAVKDIFTKQSPTKQRIAKLIQEGSTDVETAKFKLLDNINKAAPKIGKDKIAIEAIKQGFDEGVIAAVKGASPADKIKMLKSVNIMQRGKGNKQFAVLNRPSDVAGETLSNTINSVLTANKKSGRELDGVAKSLKGKPVDQSPAVTQFIDDLDSIGVRFGDDLKPIFKDSNIEGVVPSERIITQVVNRMKRTKTPDAFDVHRLKKFIDEQVTFGKTAEGLSGKTEGILKNLRRNLDGILDDNFPEYNRVNTVFSETIGALDAFQDVAGKKMNLSGPNANKAIGTLSRRLMSNAQSRVRLLDAVNEIESVAKKHGGSGKLKIEGKGLGKDDLLTQILFVDELDSVFGPVARTSFQGQIQQGIQAATTGKAGLAVKALEKGAEKLQGVNEKAAFKSIIQLLKEGN